LRKSRAEAGCPVYTRSENALDVPYGPPQRVGLQRDAERASPAEFCTEV